MKKILIIDNYDSFTYNLVHAVEQFVDGVTVVRNDKITFSLIKNFDKIILSPGPGLPKEAGKLTELIKEFASEKSMLGVCLGCQAMGEVFGLNLRNISEVRHGQQSFLTECDKEDVLFQGLSNPIQVGHYHSWVIDEASNFKDWKVIARSEELIMAITHKKLKLKGVQFHPESVLTPEGKLMLENWINS